ncbi:signal peptidase I [Amphibacillus sp. MSJ-3]|uniref:signal peptidase I n=1 Tax=Amphibacillus sp. MSJ-3 TaxID=2841505 RepID=UPI001C0E9961|nr:signal peptidase I [Amphibacillus sp. MSJ-3]MBU5595282.1 signal peptidase I [Amphibacillus sp. MSJ-3]
MKENVRTHLTKIRKLILTIFFIILFFRLFIFSFAQVIGESMAPTIQNGQWIITNHLSYSLNEPERGDIVTIDYNGEIYIKRIIGLPNETIEITDQQLYIDGIPYTQVFITDRSSFWTHDIPETKIPDQSYYVLGDNRRISKDSRNTLGFIEKSNIIGRAEFVIYPFSDWHVIH